MAYKKKSKTTKKKYSAAEKKAYWMGVGSRIPDNKNTAAFLKFNSESKEVGDAYLQGRSDGFYRKTGPFKVRRKKTLITTHSGERMWVDKIVE